MPPTKQTAFRFSEHDLWLMKQIGEELAEEGVTSVKTPSGQINLSAVLRHLVYEEDRRRREALKKKSKE
jgi:hypothetical protein